MSEKKVSLSKEQLKTKPKVEDVMNEILDGDILKNALDFVAYLRENKMNPKWTATNAWWVDYKGKRLVSIRVGPKEPGPWGYGLESRSWHIGHWLQGFALSHDLSKEFEDSIAYDKFKEFVWNNMQPCKKCMSCAPGHSGTYFGKKFDSVCYFRVENPDTGTLEFVKKLLDCKKKVIAANINP